jgi:transcriptional regulator with XRE-family HTH domain
MVQQLVRRKVSEIPRRRLTCQLQYFLDRQKMTQQELAEKTGLAISTIGLYCRNQINRIDTTTAEILCDEFDCDMCDLFPRSQDVQ